MRKVFKFHSFLNEYIINLNTATDNYDNYFYNLVKNITRILY